MKFLLWLWFFLGLGDYRPAQTTPDISGDETSVSVVNVKVDENSGGIVIPFLTNIDVSVDGFVETNGVTFVFEPEPEPEDVVFVPRSGFFEQFIRHRRGKK
jgi:hypothetical protein